MHLGITESGVKGSVAVLILENLKVCTKERTWGGESLMKARLRLENSWATVVQEYTATEDKAQELTTSFNNSVKEMLASRDFSTAVLLTYWLTLVVLLLDIMCLKFRFFVDFDWCF